MKTVWFAGAVDVLIFVAGFVITLSLSPELAWASAPFLTDNPEPTKYRHFETYLFSTFDKAKDSTTMLLPGFEIDYGAIPNIQLHAVVPGVRYAESDDAVHYGLGDIEAGFVYRFIQEKRYFPQIGILPTIVLPSGDPDRGLGNGHTWARFPIAFQKSWKPWETYGSAGYVVNNASDKRNYAYGGWLIERQLGGHITLGGEIFARGAPDSQGRSTGILDIGGNYSLGENCRILLSGGRSIAGERHFVAYLGLYLTWSRRLIMNRASKNGIRLSYIAM